MVGNRICNLWCLKNLRKELGERKRWGKKDENQNLAYSLATPFHVVRWMKVGMRHKTRQPGLLGMIALFSISGFMGVYIYIQAKYFYNEYPKWDLNY